MDRLVQAGKPAFSKIERAKEKHNSFFFDFCAHCSGISDCSSVVSVVLLTAAPTMLFTTSNGWWCGCKNIKSSPCWLHSMNIVVDSCAFQTNSLKELEKPSSAKQVYKFSLPALDLMGRPWLQTTGRGSGKMI